MKQNFTPNSLIKYLYKETTTSDRLAIEDELMDNPCLKEEFDGLFKAYKQLPKVSFSPSSSVIQKILGYSERTALEKLA